MKEFPETVKHLMALAKEAVQNQQVTQAKNYYQQILELAPAFETVRDYAYFLLQQEEWAEARAILADFGGYFLQHQQLPAYWQDLITAQDYLGFDQSRDWLLRQGYELNQSEIACWHQLQQKLSKVEFSEDRLARLTADLLMVATTSRGDWSQVFNQVKLLTPSAFLQVVTPSLVSPNLSVLARVTLLNEISQFSQIPELQIWWRGQLREIKPTALVPLQSVELFQKLVAELARTAEEQQMSETKQQFVFSNLTVYFWLTYPFSTEELTPIEVWRDFFYSGRIAETITSEQRQQLNYWQQEEQKMLAQLNL